MLGTPAVDLPEFVQQTGLNKWLTELSVYWHVASAYINLGPLPDAKTPPALIYIMILELDLHTNNYSGRPWVYLNIVSQWPCNIKLGGKPTSLRLAVNLCAHGGLVRTLAALKHTQYFWLLANNLISEQAGSKAEQKPCDKEQPARTFYDPEFLNFTEEGTRGYQRQLSHRLFLGSSRNQKVL